MLFVGSSRVQKLNSLPEVTREHYLNVRSKDHNDWIVTEFEKHFEARKQKGKDKFSGAYFSFVNFEYSASNL